MKRFVLFLLLTCSISTFFAQNQAKGDGHAANQNVLIRIDGAATPNGKGEGENSSPVLGTETVNFTATPEGIYITILSGTNKIKLFALTGQLLLNGDLKQGRFFIPTRKGIYLLRINNNNFKVICR